VEEVLDQVEKMVRPHLQSFDFRPVSSGEPRWRNKARWERFNMVLEGLLRDDSPRGIWELTEKGWQEARKLLENEG
ncbi:MAG: winged helix-turn-helix domain-containing protein, partial [Armatimonadetes bacterium]|nr:winged helix-turn-helix domain-containing protein [Armatimonadota bacterium]